VAVAASTFLTPLGVPAPMPLLGTVVKVALVVVAVLLLVAGVAYAADYGVGGTVEKKSRDPRTGEYVVHLGLDLGPTFKQALGPDQWNCLREGNYVKYHVRSGHTIIYSEKGGRVLYDSEVPGVPEACLQGGPGGGSGFPLSNPIL